MFSQKPPPDLSTLVTQAKSHHKLQDKVTGQVVGYALLMTDQPVTADQVHLVPWYGEDQLQVGCRQDTVLASDLDLSQDSSINGTIEEECSSISNDIHEISVNCEPILELLECPSPNLTSSSTSSNLASITPVSSLSSLESPSPPVYTNIRQVPSSLNLVTQSLASEIAASLSEKKATSSTSSTAVGMSQHRKRSLEGESEEKLKSQKTEAQRQFLPGMPGRYDSFYEDVSEDGVEKKYRRVKCLLCGNGKLLSLGNFHRHIKTMHEPPVKCEGCGKEFSGEQIKKHIKVCHK